MNHSVVLCVARTASTDPASLQTAFWLGGWITKRKLITDAWWRGSQSSAVRAIRTQLVLRFHVTCRSPGDDKARECKPPTRVVKDLTRQLPIQRSAVPFCQGTGMLVRFGCRPVAFKNLMTLNIKR